jgi:AcrR family transcriptional regulator
MSYVRKTNQTKQLIRNAMLEVMEKNSFESMTIDQISEKAMITRSTFYRYYDDKYELVSEIEDEILTYIESIRDSEQISGELFSSNQIKYSMNAVKKYTPTIRLLLGENGDIGFVPKIQRSVSYIFFGNENIARTPKNQVIEELMVAIVVKSFQMLPSSNVSIDDKAEILSSILNKGIINTLRGN